MDAEKLASVLKFHQEELEVGGYEAKEYKSYSDFAYGHRSEYHLRHANWMCGQALKFIDRGDIDKAMRWLGFIQGILFMTNYHTLDFLRKNSR